MTIQIIINKTGRIVETGDLPQNAKDFVFEYGLKQILNDCHSAIKRADFKTEEEFVSAVNSAVDKKLAAIESGQLTIRKAAEPLNPLEKIINRLGVEAIAGALKRKGIARKTLEEGKFETLVTGYIAKNRAELEETAKAELARLSAMPQVDIDLADLLA